MSYSCSFPKTTVKTKSIKWEGVSSLSNFETTAASVKATITCLFWSLLSGIPHNNQVKWIAERPGKGEFVSVKPRQPKPATSHTDSLLKEGSTTEMTQQANANLADSLLFPCPDNGCTKSFMTYGRLEQHLMYGKHQFRRAESVSLIDRAKLSSAECLEAGRSHPEMTIPDTEIHSGSPCLPEGWACRESAMPRHQLNSKQIRYMKEKFKHGETTGIKASPDDVSEEMRCLRDQSGKGTFTL